MRDAWLTVDLQDPTFQVKSVGLFDDLPNAKQAAAPHYEVRLLRDQWPRHQLFQDQEFRPVIEATVYLYYSHPAVGSYSQQRDSRNKRPE